MSQTLPIIQNFLDYLVDERHFSPYTSRCYGLDLRQFSEFLIEDMSIEINMENETDALATHESGEGGGEGTLTAVILNADCGNPLWLDSNMN